MSAPLFLEVTDDATGETLLVNASEVVTVEVDSEHTTCLRIKTSAWPFPIIRVRELWSDIADAVNAHRVPGRAGRSEGFTLLSLLVAIAVLGIISLFVLPHFLCYLDKAKVAKRVTDVKVAYERVEQFMLDGTIPPDTLDEAFAGTRMPEGLVYCSAYYQDANSGHGNDCDFYDEQNPGKSNPGEYHGTRVFRYVIRTADRDLCRSGCGSTDFVWATSGSGPLVVEKGEWQGPLPGRRTQ